MPDSVTAPAWTIVPPRMVPAICADSALNAVSSLKASADAVSPMLLPPPELIDSAPCAITDSTPPALTVSISAVPAVIVTLPDPLIVATLVSPVVAMPMTLPESPRCRKRRTGQRQRCAAVEVTADDRPRGGHHRPDIRRGQIAVIDRQAAEREAFRGAVVERQRARRPRVEQTGRAGGTDRDIGAAQRRGTARIDLRAAADVARRGQRQPGAAVQLVSRRDAGIAGWSATACPRWYP